MYFTVGSDYGQNGVTTYDVQFPTGVSMQPVNIRIINDNVVEGDEMFRVTIDPSSVMGVVVGTPNEAVVTIVESTG